MGKIIYYVGIGLAVLLGSLSYYFFMFVDTQLPNFQGKEDQIILLSVFVAGVGFLSPIALKKFVSEYRWKTISEIFSDSKKIPHRDFSPRTKEIVQERQHGRCAKCGEYPKHWNFHHIGRRDDISPRNCKGLCLDCHEDITRTERKDRHSRI